MATLRPAVNQDDNYFNKIVKYIPAEIITAFTGIAGALAVDPSIALPEKNIKLYCISLLILIILTPIYMYFAVIDGNISDPKLRKKKAIFHAIIAAIAFIIYVYAIGHRQMIAIIYGCVEPNVPCESYFPAYGAVILGLFTVFTPMMERIILGPSAK